MNEVNKKAEYNAIKFSKYDWKKICAVVFMIILLYSVSTKFVTLTGDNIVLLDMYMFEVSSVQLTLSFAIIYLYSIFTDKKKLSYLVLFLLFVSFIYSAYIYFNIETVVSNMSEQTIVYIKNHTKYGEGIVFYCISFIILIINVFLPGKKKTRNETQTFNNEINNSCAINDNYIFATYIYGIEKCPSLYNKLSVLIDDDTSGILNININIEAEKPEIISIPKKDIKDIKYKLSIISKEVMSEKVYGPAEHVRDIALFGGPTFLIIKCIKGDKIKDYYKMKSTQVYDITIIYCEDNEEKKIMFQTKENPNKFLNNIKKLG